MRSFVAGFAFLALLMSTPGQAQGILTLEKRIPLPDVQGRIDHLAVDREGSRLFVAALGNNTVEVVDLHAAARVRTLKGFRKPQGLLYEGGRLYAASGDDGFLRVFDSKSLHLLHETQGLGDADNVRADRSKQQILVGYGEGAIGIFDTGGSKIAEVPLPAHPESFQVDPASSRVFVNVPDKQAVFVVDIAKRAVVAKWPLAVAANFPMAFDSAHQRLFIGARKPARLAVLDAANGRVVNAIDIVADTDDLFYDAARQRIYVIGGGGAVTVIHQDDADHYRTEAAIPTQPGARTGLFVPELGSLYVAAPKHGNEPAAILVYRTAPR